MPFLPKFLFYFETGEQCILMIFGDLNKSGLKSNDCKEIGKVCSYVGTFNKIENFSESVKLSK